MRNPHAERGALHWHVEAASAESGRHMSELASLDFRSRGIDTIRPFPQLDLQNLRTLDLSGNALRALDGLRHVALPSLTSLDLHDNAVATVADREIPLTQWTSVFVSRRFAMKALAASK